MKKIILLLLIFISIFSISLAHSGRTDSNGGHWDYSTGEYHYHKETQLEVNLNTDNEETKKSEKSKQAKNEKETVLTDYTGVMNILDEKDTEIEKLKDDKKSLHFIYWFIIICMGLTIWNLSRENKK